MSAAHLIDCHILTLPRFDPGWVAQLRKDLDAEPVNQHWLPGIDGRLGDARADGFSAGDAPLVTSADPDDRLLFGTYGALLQALEANPAAPFAWAGEKLVDEELKDLPTRTHVWPGGYHPVTHVSKGTHVHGVKLYRRESVAPVLDMMRRAGQCCEFLLDLALVKPWTMPPRAAWPVHVPVVGRLWRQHGQNGSKFISDRDFDRMANELGFSTMRELRNDVFLRCKY